MSKTSTFEVKFKRRRQQKTNYRKRISLLVSKKPRVVVRKSNKHIVAQLVLFDHKGDITKCAASSKELGKIGWTHSTANTSAAYLTGYLCGVRAKKLEVKEAILDLGLHSPIYGSKVFACLKGFINAGVKVPVSEEVFPKEDRLKGKHLKHPLDGAEFEKIMKKIEQKDGELNG